MDEVEHLFYRLPHPLPFIVIEFSTGEGTKPDAERISMLDEGRVLSTVWNLIKRQLVLSPKRNYVPVDEDGNEIDPFENKEANKRKAEGDRNQLTLLGPGSRPF